ncbi:MAG: response regulator [Nitrospirae bacterium]|nr:response regulator [Nitrospirota bacterium]MBF0541039.1 response regulator [Nitrospirota bacterium]
MNKIAKALIIDDEAQIRRLLRVSFESSNYLVEEAPNGKEGLKLLPLVQPDFVILDLGLPDMDGLEVLKTIRSYSEVPIIILSVRFDEQTIITALDNGADDYIIKPFNVGVILARIRTVLRKTINVSTTEVFINGQLKIDFNARIAAVNGDEIKLTSKEYDLLCIFAKYIGKIITHRQLLKEVWGSQSVEHNQYLRVYVGHLRQKIESDPKNPKMLITEPGIGYRFCII